AVDRHLFFGILVSLLRCLFRLDATTGAGCQEQRESQSEQQRRATTLGGGSRGGSHSFVVVPRSQVTLAGSPPVSGCPGRVGGESIDRVVQSITTFHWW